MRAGRQRFLLDLKLLLCLYLGRLFLDDLIGEARRGALALRRRIREHRPQRANPHAERGTRSAAVRPQQRLQLGRKDEGLAGHLAGGGEVHPAGVAGITHRPILVAGSRPPHGAQGAEEKLHVAERPAGGALPRTDRLDLHPSLLLDLLRPAGHEDAGAIRGREGDARRGCACMLDHIGDGFTYQLQRVNLLVGGQLGAVEPVMQRDDSPQPRNRNPALVGSHIRRDVFPERHFPFGTWLIETMLWLRFYIGIIHKAIPFGG